MVRPLNAQLGTSSLLINFSQLKGYSKSINRKYSLQLKLNSSDPERTIISLYTKSLYVSGAFTTQPLCVFNEDGEASTDGDWSLELRCG